MAYLPVTRTGYGVDLHFIKYITPSPKEGVTFFIHSRERNDTYIVTILGSQGMFYVTRKCLIFSFCILLSTLDLKTIFELDEYCLPEFIPKWDESLASGNYPVTKTNKNKNKTKQTNTKREEQKMFKIIIDRIKC